MDAAWVAKKTKQARATARERNVRLLEFARREREILLQTPEEDRMPWADGGGYDVLCDLLPRAIDETISPDDIETLLLAFMRVNLENDIEEVVSEEGKGRETAADRLERAIGMRRIGLYADDILPDYRHLQDTEFDLPRGDYVITDPCYFGMRGDEPSCLPILHARDTLYGDWGCTMYEVPVDGEGNPVDGGESVPVGRFCADAGLVCVADLDALSECVPEKVEEVTGKDWVATVIRDFEGVGRFVVEEYPYMSVTPRDGRQDYSLHYEYDLHVVLDGTDCTTGRHVRYESRQTSL